MNFDQYMPFGLSAVDLVAVIAAMSTFLAFVAVYSSGLISDPLRKRLRQIEDRRSILRETALSSKSRQVDVRKKAGLSMARGLVSRANLLESQQARNAARKLARAGWRTRDSLILYLFFKLVLPVFVLLSAVMLLYVFDVGKYSDSSRLMLAIGSILGAFVAPDIFVKNYTTRRSDAIRKAVPDALDLMVICAEAGLSLDASLKRTANELGRSFPEIADELLLTSVELGFLPDRRTALSNLNDRVDQSSMRSVTATLLQTEKYGTPLAQSLRVLSAEFRNERLMRAEEKAARLPAVLTVPLVVFILPALFVVLIGPAILDVYDNLINM